MLGEIFTNVVNAAHKSTRNNNAKKRYTLDGNSPFKSEFIVVGCYGFKKFNKLVEKYKEQGFRLYTKPYIKHTYSRKYGKGIYVSCTMRRVTATYEDFPYGSIAAQKRADDDRGRMKEIEETWDSLPKAVKTGIAGTAAVGAVALGGYVLKELWDNL